LSLPNPSTATSIMYSLYKLNRINDTLQTCLNPLQIFTLLGPVFLLTLCSVDNSPINLRTTKTAPCLTSQIRVIHIDGDAQRKFSNSQSDHETQVDLATQTDRQTDRQTNWPTIVTGFDFWRYNTGFLFCGKKFAKLRVKRLKCAGIFDKPNHRHMDSSYMIPLDKTEVSLQTCWMHRIVTKRKDLSRLKCKGFL
jgi:hypothetical protein